MAQATTSRSTSATATPFTQVGSVPIVQAATTAAITLTRPEGVQVQAERVPYTPDTLADDTLSMPTDAVFQKAERIEKTSNYRMVLKPSYDASEVFHVYRLHINNVETLVTDL
ncbi:hypothetical protein Syun_003350 [Stephania yunnanensis]|uniref:Uncharacterized protein n=1 Tax=Stephania yunnanensis TaxID=152371 RepID=A0AAP0L110_9MAGN